MISLYISLRTESVGAARRLVPAIASTVFAKLHNRHSSGPTIIMTSHRTRKHQCAIRQHEAEY